MAHVCRECGKPLDGKRKGAVFCGAEHRKTWNNRRMVRGAEMYDLFMANRYEREKANGEKAWTHLTNLARAYRDADIALRDGRQSWNLREALERLPIAYGNQGDKR
jgi:hypothetical protein